jgi:DNA invertase Pin-like site-specific DNA recombinase
MTTTFRLNEKELSEKIIKAIRSAFKNKDILITISDVADETDYLLSTDANRKHLQRSMEDIQSGKGVTFTLNELLECLDRN